MTYEETKNSMMTEFPTLFVNEDDVLHHLFAVIGNGYDWVDGELSDGEDKTVEQAKAARLERLKDDLRQEFYNRFPDYREPEDVEEARLKEKNRRPATYDSRLYPICHFSKIMCVPDDVKRDWKDAAKKALNLFLSGRYKTTDSDKKLLTEAMLKIATL